MENTQPTVVISQDLHRHTKNLHVLYVEDSATMRNATKKILSQYFEHIDTANDGVEGLSSYRNFHIQNERNYDIVISDLEMPNMDGKQLSAAILSIDPSQEIIIISSSSEFTLLLDLLNLGVKKFLAKPIQLQQLHEVINEVAHNLHLKRIKADELLEVSQHNLLLQKREEIYLSKLENSYNRLEEFNQALNESSIVSKTDADGFITYVNKKFCEISGYTEDELIGKKHNIVSSGEMISSFYKKLWNTITNQKSYKGVFKNKSKTGTIYYAQALIKPIVNLEGTIVEYISISNDITRMMKSIEIAKHAEQGKDDFFRNISHEMRTPLNSILGLSSLLKHRANGDPKLMELLNVIEKNSKNLSDLVESILDFQRLQHNQLELVVKEFETTLLYTFILSHYESKLKEKNLHFEHSFDTSIPPTLIGDLGRIQQIIMSVMDNAIKFTPKSGSIYLSFSYSYDDSLLFCQVQDTGIGIAIEDQEKIFTLTQIDASLTRKHEGAGLGLTVAHAILKKMNGFFTVHSIPKQGSTFLIEIPLKHL